MLKITYYHTLYKEDVSELTDKIEFHYTDHAYVTFKAFGHGHLVDAKYIRTIESIED